MERAFRSVETSWGPATMAGPAGSTPVEGLRTAWARHAARSCRGYSPIYEQISHAVAHSDRVLEVLASAPPDARDPVLVLATVHFLLLSGLEHPLAAVYAATSSAGPGPLFTDLCLRHRDELLRHLPARRVNTNEVGRSATLGPALTLVAARHGAPLAQLDVGSSAGLNLLSDRYLLDYGPAGVTGPPGAAVRIACEVVGGTPPIAPRLPPVRARVGLDRDPVDVQDDGDMRWQLACVWPDTGRLGRTRAALDEARRAPVTSVTGDAVDDVEAALALLPAGATAVVTTTWVLSYLSRDRRAAFRAALTAASRHRTIAWVSAERRGVVTGLVPTTGATGAADAVGADVTVLGLVTLVAGHARDELLGYAHPHGHVLDWHAT